MTRTRFYVYRFGILMALLIPWEWLAGGLGNTNPLWKAHLVGRPSLILIALTQILFTKTTWQHTMVTTLQAIGGIVFGGGTGILFGVALGRSRPLESIFLPYINAFNAIPRLALAPFLLVWLGIGYPSKVAMSTMMAFFPIFFAAYEGARHVDPALLAAINVMGASRRQTFRIVIVPSIMSWVTGGIAASVGFSLVGSVIGEYLGASAGLGYLLMSKRNMQDINGSLAIVLILAAVGLLLNHLARCGEQRFVKK